MPAVGCTLLLAVVTLVKGSYPLGIARDPRQRNEMNHRDGRPGRVAGNERHRVRGAGLQFPDQHAACVAQAWVPSNTDPELEPGDLGAFIREFAHTGEWGHEIKQQGCKP
jgi:hypothetical protein